MSRHTLDDEAQALRQLARQKQPHDQAQYWIKRALDAYAREDWDLVLIALANASVFVEMAHPAHALAVEKIQKERGKL